MEKTEPPYATTIQTGNSEKINLTFQESNNNPQNQSQTFTTFEEPTIEEPDIVKEAAQQGIDAVSNLDDQPMQEKKSSKYHIIDLFWIVNEQMYQESYELKENEAQFVILSYNLDFGNLKISFFKIPFGAVVNTVVYRQMLTPLISGTMYPSSCFAALSKQNSTAMEQLIKRNDEPWEKERPIMKTTNNQDAIQLNMTNPKTQDTYFYNFQGWQRELFEYSLKYTYTEGFQLRGQNCLLK